jgi:peptide deformylase
MTNPGSFSEVLVGAEWMVANLPQLRYFGDPLLRQVGRPFEREEFGGAEVLALGKQLTETLAAYREHAGSGRGLAANQVGSDRRMVLVWLDNEPVCAVNPSPIKLEGRGSYSEACLSGGSIIIGEVTRPWVGEFEYFTLNGERVVLKADPIQTRLFLHEIDHLNGLICFDKYEPGTVGFVTGGPSQILGATLKRLE